MEEKQNTPNIQPPLPPQQIPQPNQQLPQPAQPQQPQSKFSDSQAQAILAINSLETKQAAKSSKTFLFLVIGGVILLVALTLFIESRNHSNINKSSTSSSTSTSSNPFNSGKGSIDSETKYCSNAVNAALTC